MFKLNRKFQEAQYAWIREHPVLYVTLNVTVIAMFLGYMEYKDRQFNRELEEARTQHSI
ncbi:MAG TPA: hypothetical protein VN843_21690 [Anaerolineales bacterium]|nr:hypothetical protein [Anaerolineales bacterium]